MIPELRKTFNANFTPGAHHRFLQDLKSIVGAPIEFRPCETPVFLPQPLLGEMVTAAKEMIAHLSTPAYLETSERSIPAAYRAPNEGSHPHFIQVDFAVVRSPDGGFAPKLIELQGCASLYAFQYMLPQAYGRQYDLKGLGSFLDGLDESSYLDLLREVIVGNAPAEQVILMEIDPTGQKTLPDFTLTEKLFGVPYVNITKIKKRGRKLYYRRDGHEIEIRRLYNRVIIDELIRKNLAIDFDFRDDLDVEWVGHPNWYFRMSKFSLPFLQHPAAPRAWFLDQLSEYPAELDRFVLKPLFSFAGSGVKVSVGSEDLERVPRGQRGDYLLQEKVAYAPVIETPDKPSKVEVRIMFVWPDAAASPSAVTTLTRLSKGAMMGVDFNKNKTWVGSSCGLFPCE